MVEGLAVSSQQLAVGGTGGVYRRSSVCFTDPSNTARGHNDAAANC